MSNLSVEVKEAVGEEEVYGKNIRREINLKWNNMELALEKKDVKGFVELSKEVQSYLKVLMGDAGMVRDKLGGARYCIIEIKDWDIARSLVEDVKKIVENEGTPLANGVI